MTCFFRSDIKIKYFFLICLFLLSLSSAFAKRSAPPEVSPIIHNGYEYSADYCGGLFSGKGVVIIKNIKTGVIVRRITLYRNVYIPFMETDVQWVFIKSMELLDNNTIRIINEGNQIFDLNIKTRIVTRRLFGN